MARTASGSGSPGGNGGDSGDTGQGGGYSTGGQNQNNSNGAAPQTGFVTTPQQVPSNGRFQPDESSVNPYLGDAGNGSVPDVGRSRSSRRSRSKPTQGNDAGSIPLGMRDLVKDYFSSLDKK